jgi:hypothetical protein
MNNKLWLFAVPALVAASAVSAVEVDDFSGYFTAAVGSYNYLGIEDISKNPTYYAGSGFESVANATNKDVVAFNIYGFNPLELTYTGPGDSFTLDSFYLAGGWGSETVTFTGFKDGVQVGTVAYNATTTAVAYPSLSWSAIDKLVVQVDNYVPQPGLQGSGETWVLGGVNITPVPEPESYAMLLAGLAVVGVVARRRAASRV